MTKVLNLPYKVLIAVSNAENLAALLKLAIPLARAKRGGVIPLYVAQDPHPPSWFQIPQDFEDVAQEPLIVHHRDAGKGILRAVRDLQPDILLLCWSGKPSKGRYLLGRTLDPVIQYAPCDVAVVSLGAKSGSLVEQMGNLSQVLVPVGGGPNAILALDIALTFTPQVRVTALRVASLGLGRAAMAAQQELLAAALEPFAGEERIQPKVIFASSIQNGILHEAKQGYNVMLVGATRESFVDRLLFGNLPQSLAAHSPIPIIIVRRHETTAASLLRRARWRLINVLPQLSFDERVQVYRRVRRTTRADIDFYVMMILATSVGSLGLLLDSSAVIIGAMIIAPMMSALVGIGMGIVQGDARLLFQGLRTVILGTLIMLWISALVGFIVPDNQVTREMMARSRPTLMDLAVALVSGAAAAYATARRNVASALPGVAIAVALVPPLSTVGLALSAHDRQVALGASLLFATNLVAIVAAVTMIFLWIGFRPNASEAPPRARTFRGGVWGTTILLLSVTAVLAILSLRSIRTSHLRRTTNQVLTTYIDEHQPSMELMDWSLVERGEFIEITVTLLAADPPSPIELADLQSALNKQLPKPVALDVATVPMTRLPARR